MNFVNFEESCLTIAGIAIIVKPMKKAMKKRSRQRSLSERNPHGLEGIFRKKLLKVALEPES